MQQSPWEANRVSASPEIPLILCKPQVHCRVNKSPPPPVPVLTQISPVHTPIPPHVQKIHHNIIIPSTPGSSKWSLSLRFPHQNPVYTPPLPHMCHIPRPSHSSRFYHSNNICEQYRSLSSSLCSFLHSPVTPSLLGPNILVSTLFSNTLSLCSSLNVSDHVSHPYETTGTIVVRTYIYTEYNTFCTPQTLKK